MHFNRTTTLTASDGSLYEQVTCGCPNQQPINVPHALIVEAHETGATVGATAQRLHTWKTRDRNAVQMSVYTAAEHLVKQGIIPTMPAYWDTWTPT